MRSGSSLALRLALCLLVVATGLIPPAAAAQQGPDPEGSVIEIRLHPDGNATFVVSTTFRLDSQADRERFEDRAEEFTLGRSDATFSLDPFRNAAAAAADATGRSMDVRLLGRRSDSTNTTGRLSLVFEWTAFSQVRADRLHVGDTFETANGTWLRRLGSDQELVIRPPENYAVNASFVRPRSGGVLRVAGPATFDPGDVYAVYERTEETPVTTTITSTDATPTTASSTTTDDDPGLDLSVLPLIGGLVIGMAAVALGLYAASRDEDEDGGGDEGPSPAGRGDGGYGGRPTVEPAGGADGSAGEDAGRGDAAVDGGDAPVDEVLLSDEERVERLLRENGGRMKQANIVRETGWSNAKVSQLLSSMADAGQVSKLRIGRENLISLPEADGRADDE